jgi:hypothetical protein
MGIDPAGDNAKISGQVEYHVTRQERTVHLSLPSRLAVVAVDDQGLTIPLDRVWLIGGDSQ